MESLKKRIRLSVIIPTQNRPDELIRAVDLLEKQLDKHDDEIIIVDDGSSNKNRLKNKSLTNVYKNIVLLYKNNSGPATARNMALNRSRGDVVIFINDDTLISDGFIEKHIEFHLNNRKRTEALVGPFIEYPKLIKTPIMRWLVIDSKMHFKYVETDNGLLPWYYFWTCNLSIKREFLTINKLFFDKSFPVAAWEDVEFGYRAKKCGLNIHYDKSLIAWHNHSFNLDSLLSRFFSHGRGMYHLIGKLPEKDLPFLAKFRYRILAKIMLAVTIYPLLSIVLKNIIDIEKHPNTILLQYLIVGEKIRGWNYESKK
jgi:glycosyltransferase involved in cell wall biosynthesis